MRTLAPLAALLLLTACDGGGDPVHQALRDTSSANHAAAAKTTEEAEAVDHAAMGHGPGATPGDRAFAASEAEMHQRMGAASGETVDQAYIAKMIAHHQGAVAMAEVALAESRDPEIRRMAQVVIDAETREIAEMQAWKPTVSPAGR